MFRRIRWRLLASYLIVVAAALVFVGVHLTRQFEAAFVSQQETDLRSELRHVRLVVAWAVIVALTIATGLGLFLTRGIAGPIQEMQRVASTLAAGHLSQRIPVRTQDELGDLARSLNYMASELERIDSMRRAFVADASHELRTPVANLAVAVEALKSVVGKDSGQAEAVAADLEREVMRLRRLVEDLLDLSLVEAGQVKLNLSWVSLGELVRRSVQSFQPRAERAGVMLAAEIPANLSRVRADADRTVEVITNLLDNAFKHTPAGGKISVSVYERRGHVLMSVTDTGPGIPASDLPHIFDRFYKVDKSRSGGQGGAGLGLAIAKRLMEAQGGLVMAESNEGHGARFIVAFPKEG